MGVRQGNIEMWRRYIFFALWLVTSAASVWLVLQGQHAFDSPMSTPVILMLLFYTTAAFLWWLPRPALDDPSDPTQTRRGQFVLAMVAAAGLLFALPLLIDKPLVFALPVIGAIVLVFLRSQITRREVLYVIGLALVAGLAGLGAGWIIFLPPIVWAMLQVALVVTGFLAGWSILRRAGLLQVGIGRSRYLTEGTASALQGFVQGVVLAIPWAVGAVALGNSSKENWVQQWWQPVIAIQPGIAEESWGRMLLVPLLFLLLRRYARTGAAFTAALVIVAYWFAYLHTSGGLDVFSTLIIGTLYVLPISYLCFCRDVETAIGFHFWIDFVKFAAAYLLNAGLWFS